MEDIGDLNFPPRKNLVRQLDFSSAGGGCVPPPATVTTTTVSLSDHPHLPIIAQQPPSKPVKPESPKAQPRQIVDAKDGTPKKQKRCNCKHSRCLKLYCECFALGVYCDGCNCVNCHNNVENEPARREAVAVTLERNPEAFMPKFANSPHGRNSKNREAGEGVILEKHNKGCNCKKTCCLKRYCECFQAGILCSENCKCMDCKNFEGSEERDFRVNSVNNHDIFDLQGAIGIYGYGSSLVSRKRNAHGGPVAKDSSFHGLLQFRQTNHVKASTPLSSLPSVRSARVTNDAPVGRSKSAYRSLLADLIRSEDIKELCAVLVVYAREAARLLSDDQNAKDKMETNINDEILKASSAQKPVADETLSGSRPDKPGPDSSKPRAMSPGTLALMCDEDYTAFIDSASSGSPDHGRVTNGNLLNGQVITDTYAEQEKTILTTFRDYLKRLVSFGEIKETQCSSLARSDSRNQSQMEEVKSSVTNTCWNNRSTVAPATELSQNNDDRLHLNIPFHVEDIDSKLKDIGQC